MYPVTDWGKYDHRKQLSYNFVWNNPSKFLNFTLDVWFRFLNKSKSLQLRRIRGFCGVQSSSKHSFIANIGQTCICLWERKRIVGVSVRVCVAVRMCSCAYVWPCVWENGSVFPTMSFDPVEMCWILKF